MFKLLTQEQALQAVETACKHILTDSLSVEGKLLMFNSFAQSLSLWVTANLIEYDWLDMLLNYILEVKEIYRQSVKVVRK